MDPQDQFCHNSDCSDRGQSGLGNIRIHSRKKQRYCCSTCGRTFAAMTGTPFYRLRTATDMVTVVLTLLCHGCPLQAIVAAFGFDECTVAQWQARAGEHCQEVHEHLVQQGQVDLGHVQADELWVKMVGQRMWMAMALVLKATGGTVINTAYIERLNAPFRSALAPLVRRGRALAHTETRLTAGMYLVGCAYNLCWTHDSLRLAAPENAPRKWQERTPAMTAGLTDHRWTLRELLLLKVPLPPWVASKRRGHPPNP